MPDATTPVATELVLGVPRDRVPGGLDWRGLRSGAADHYLELAAREGTFRPRSEAEGDPSWKQIIPYLCLRDGERIFLMRRTRAGTDARLHGRYSIGIGGHVNPEDTDPLGGLQREWTEELAADFEPRFEPVGVLNDDTNPVGAVHLGLVFTADAGGQPVAIRETAKLSGGFATLDEVAAIAPDLETWSGLLFEFLLKERARTRQVR
ncbi:NUDIX domain-containing protein [soil metagenome]